MVLDATQLSSVIGDLLAEHQADQERLDMIANHLAGKTCDIYLPEGANSEYRLIVEQSQFNVLPLFVKQLAQDLFVDGYRPTADSGRAPSRENAPIWDEVWQPNRMDARQGALYKPAISFGYSYGTAVPGKPVPVIKPHSPRKFVAIYDDPFNDEWPQYAMQIHRAPAAKSSSKKVSKVQAAAADVGARLTVYDNVAIYDVVKTDQGWEIVGGEARLHEMGVTPAVRFLDEWDADQLPTGKIQQLIPPQKQANQTTFGLGMAQQFGAFKQRYVSGMAEEDAKLRARVDAILASTSADTKWGEFTETDLNGYLNSREKTLLFMAAVGQAAPHQVIIGAGISNISADALVALQTSHDHDVQQHKTSFGESVEQLLRLAGKAMGDEKAWADTSAQVVWRDTTPRSLAQVADALGKLATQLDIPPEALWERIPGVTDQDIRSWQDMRSAADLMGELEGMVNGIREEPVAVGSSNGSNPTPPS